MFLFLSASGIFITAIIAFLGGAGKSIFFVLLALLNVVFITFLISNWFEMRGMAKKLLALVCLGVFPVFWGTSVVGYNLERMKDIQFCSNCHVMTPYIESLKVNNNHSLPSVHFQNNWVPKNTACYTCHTDYTVFGPLKAKLKVFKYVWDYYTENYPESFTLNEPLRNRVCLRCHGPSKTYLDVSEHHNLFYQIEREEKSCIANACHDTGHILTR